MSRFVRPDLTKQTSQYSPIPQIYQTPHAWSQICMIPLQVWWGVFNVWGKGLATHHASDTHHPVSNGHEIWPNPPSWRTEISWFKQKAMPLSMRGLCRCPVGCVLKVWWEGEVINRYIMGVFTITRASSNIFDVTWSLFNSFEQCSNSRLMKK